MLLFVFWYCHKRGREVRLDKERIATSAEASETETDLEDSTVLESEAAEPTLSTDNDPDLEKILNQPEPKEVALPESPSVGR